MAVSEMAGTPADASALVDVAVLESAYYTRVPDPSVPGQRVAFGTSGHRGTSTDGSFNEAHIVATTEAIRRHRVRQGIDGPVFIGRDTHALSWPAFRTAVEILIAAGVPVVVDADGGYTPTPVISHAILGHNRRRSDHLADGIVVTPSHNPPGDGGFKYNPPNGGPAGPEVTNGIQAEANALLASGWQAIPRVAYERALGDANLKRYYYVGAYVSELPAVIDMDLIAGAGLRVGVDPLGGASVGYWQAIAERFGLDLDVVNKTVDPTFGFMPRDWDGRIRMDPSSTHAMAGLVSLKDRFDVAFANDPDADRHGIVVPGAGLLNPNHYLSVVVSYLFGGQRDWDRRAGVGKTLVTTSMVDRVAADLGRHLLEVPVGFKWFVDGLVEGSLGFGGEESAGASFLRRDGSAWSTDKDGLILALLAVEMTARTGADPGQLYGGLTQRFGAPAYQRIDAPATPEQKDKLKRLTARQITARELAGEAITAVLTTAPGNGEPIGGVKIVTQAGWAATRPSGTENVYKIYAESFRSPRHLHQILDEARQIVDSALAT